MGLGIVAHIVFWILTVATAVESGMRSALLLVALWVAGYVAAGWLTLVGGYLFDSYVAVLDVIVILVVFRGQLPFLSER